MRKNHNRSGGARRGWVSIRIPEFQPWLWMFCPLPLLNGRQATGRVWNPPLQRLPSTPVLCVHSHRQKGGQPHQRQTRRSAPTPFSLISSSAGDNHIITSSSLNSPILYLKCSLAVLKHRYLLTPWTAVIGHNGFTRHLAG